jgi:hypothetical protein
MTDNLILDKIEERREKGRERAKKHYDKNKQSILLKQKQRRQKLTEEYNAILQEKQSNIQEQEQPDEPIEHIEPIVIHKNKDIINLDYVIKFIDENVEQKYTKKYYITSSKMLFRITNCDNLNKCLKKYKQIFNDIDKAERQDGTGNLSLNSKKHLMQTIVFLIDKMGIKLPKETIDFYKNKFEILKEESKQKTNDLTEENIIGYYDYLQLVKNKFGMNSKEYLIVSIYREVIVRDNFDFKIITNKNEDNGKDNFLLLPRSANATIILNNYKTFKKYGKKEIQLSNDINDLVRLYIKNNKVNKNDLLFGKEKLTQDISKMNKQIGIKGGINTTRKIAVSSGLKADDSIETRVALANKSMHSVNTQQSVYKRNVNK